MINFIKNSRFDALKLELPKGVVFSPKYEFPTLERVHFKPKKAVPFHEAMNEKDKSQWIHFYIDDHRYECIWSNPNQYLSFLKRLGGVITPDYSLYSELPVAMQIWNTYRNRVLAYWLQSSKVNIVPNISWGDERTYDFAFEGIAQGGTVAVSTNGCIQGKLERYYFKKGLDEMVRVLKPETIVNYSYTPDDIFGDCKKQGIKVIEIENRWETVRKTVK